MYYNIGLYKEKTLQNTNCKNPETFPKILFMGQPDMAVVCLNKLINSKLNIGAVILPDKTNISRENIRTIAINNNIENLEYEKTPNEPELIEKIKPLECDIGVICSLNHKLSKEFLNSTHKGFINCHPSILPKYRGGNPYFHIIKDGEKMSGITLHFADENFDTGKIIAQEIFPLSKKETMGMLFSRTNFMVADLLAKTLLKYKETGEIQSVPQKEGEFKKAPNVQGEFYINWADNINNIERLIRASNPFYNALTNFRGGYIRIVAGDFKEEKHNKPFGMIVKVKKDIMQIAAEDGYYFPNVIQAGSWGIYSISEFIEKFGPNEGEILR